MNPDPKDNFMNNTKCFKCDTPFECGVDELSCWCMDMERVQPIEGQDCLCKNCLTAKINYENHIKIHNDRYAD